MKTLKSSEEIIIQSESFKLYKKLVLQLNKDFKRANIDTSFLIDISPQNLKLKLYSVIKKLITNHYSSFLNLLYIIDVSESKIKKSTIDESENDFFEKVSFLILQREWQKVWFKNNYQK